MQHKSLLTFLAEAIDAYRLARHAARNVDCASTCQSAIIPQRKQAIRFLPTPGNMLFTLFVIGSLLWAQNVGAISLGAPTTATTSITGIPYQGRLADTNGAPLTQTVNMTFRLYAAASGGAPLWEEPWTGANSVQVSDGLFNVMLGSLTQIPQSVITGNNNLFLGITVGTDSEMSPRVQLGSVPFATQALTVPDGSITKAKLAGDVSLVPPDGSITTEKLANNAVTKDKASGFVITAGSNLMMQYGYRAAVTSTSMVINFPKTFTEAPAVIATADTVGGQSVSVSYVGLASFTVNLPNTGGNVAINWIAIGPGN